MQWLANLLKMGVDKVKHVLVGCAISAPITALCLYFGWNIWMGFVTASIVGVLKEISDSSNSNNEEFLDFMATAGGGLLPVLAYMWYTN